MSSASLPTDDSLLHPNYGHQVLQPFDIEEDARDFLADVIVTHACDPFDLQWILDLSLTAGVEQWEALIACARSIQLRQIVKADCLEAGDCLASVWRVIDPLAPAIPRDPWLETDRLIARARELEDAATRLILPTFEHIPDPKFSDEESTSSSSPRGRWTDIESHFWSQTSEAPNVASRETLSSTSSLSSLPPTSPSLSAASSGPLNGRITRKSTLRHLHKVEKRTKSCSPTGVSRTKNEIIASSRTSSPFFITTPSIPSKTQRRRPPPGTISCVPFPPLDANSFGLIQEKLAHEPFWLLIVVTFLIRTKGSTAVPVFYKVKEKFPSPSMIADPATKPQQSNTAHC